MSALSVLNRYDFKQLRPGENQDGFKFSGPGIVVIACEKKSTEPGEIHFTLVTAINADNDALEVATRVLKQGRNCDGYLFALLAQIQTKADRLAALVQLHPMCSEGT